MIKKRDIAVTTTLLNEFIEDILGDILKIGSGFITVGSGHVVSMASRLKLRQMYIANY